MHYLSILLTLPLLGAAAILFLPSSGDRLIRWMAVGFTAVTLLFSLWLAAGFDPGSAALQYHESHRWNPRLGATFSLGVDGFSLRQMER